MKLGFYCANNFWTEVVLSWVLSLTTIVYQLGSSYLFLHITQVVYDINTRVISRLSAENDKKYGNYILESYLFFGFPMKTRHAWKNWVLFGPIVALRFWINTIEAESKKSNINDVRERTSALNKQCALWGVRIGFKLFWAAELTMDRSKKDENLCSRIMIYTRAAWSDFGAFWAE